MKVCVIGSFPYLERILIRADAYTGVAKAISCLVEGHILFPILLDISVSYHNQHLKIGVAQFHYFRIYIFIFKGLWSK